MYFIFAFFFENLKEKYVLMIIMGDNIILSTYEWFSYSIICLDIFW